MPARDTTASDLRHERDRECDQCAAAAPCQPAPRCVKPVAREPVDEFRHSKVSALSPADRMRFWAIALLWLAVNLAFWGWWLRPDRPQHPVALLGGDDRALLPDDAVADGVLAVRAQDEASRRGHASADMRVAMITLCVPSSESFDVIEGQLVALGNVDYPHDSWILDEGGSDEVRALADKHGVNYFTPPRRRGMEPTRAAVPGQDQGRERQRLARPRRDPRARLRGVRPARHRPSPTHRLPRPGARLLQGPDGGVGAGSERVRQSRQLDGSRPRPSRT